MDQQNQNASFVEDAHNNPNGISVVNILNLILKVLGLFFIRDILNSLPFIVNLFIDSFGMFDTGINLVFIIAVIFIISLYVFVAYYLIIKSDYLISRFGLNKGFEGNYLHFKMEYKTILSISLFVIAAIIIVSEIPNLIIEVISFLNNKPLEDSYTNPSVADQFAASISFI